jgi:hypothetical protein
MTYPTATLEEVWALFKETDRMIKARAEENDRRAQETDRRAQENDRRAQENDREFQEMKQTMKAMSQETDRQFREMAKKIGELGSRLGDFVEGLIKPSVVKLFQERGIEVHVVTRDVEANNPALGLAMQIDLLAMNNDCCVLVEVKSHLKINDVNEHLERMEKFRPLFPAFATAKVYGAVASMVIADEVAKYAYRQGFFVIGQKGEYAVILNDEQFKPRGW